MYQDIIKDLEKNIIRLLSDKEDAILYHHYGEAERCHYKVEACKVAMEYLRDECDLDVIVTTLLDACRQLEADRPRYIAQCKVFGEVLKTMRAFPNTRLALL